jgi:carnosine N-methyltransferase
VSTLPASSYGSLASVFLHLFRDWSRTCDHVGDSTYTPAITELKQFLPNGGDVLVPGAGLGRLALALAAEGYKVEANDASRLFLTVADYLLNRPPAAAKIYPLAHVFSENWGLEQQYISVEVPQPSPTELLGSNSDGAAPSFVLVPGDFAKTYGKSGPGYRKFDAIVTCFFIDTATDLVELFDTLDGLLAEGGVWLNVGPLNWRKEARLKISYEEIVAVWEKMGYEFVSQKRIDCDYHMPRGLKMYTESYQGALTVAIKRRPHATF